MNRHRLLVSCLLSLFLLFIGPVASAWALGSIQCDAPDQCVEQQDAVKHCAEHNDRVALPDLDDLPAGDPPVSLHAFITHVPRLQQAFNATPQPAQLIAPAAPPHKPPSA